MRARDVQIVFADASTGARSPALVHQGRIGEIIQAKPEQRRRVLEEAAGVSGLHARRHEAELRLKAAESNLLRLEDVIGQLASQMDALKKQARQAIRYRTVSAQVRKAEATLYHLRWIAASIEVRDAEHAKDLGVRDVAERTGAQAEASKRQANARPTLPRRCARRKRAPAPPCIGSTSPWPNSSARNTRAQATGWPNSTCGSCSSPPTASASRSSPPMRAKRSPGIAEEEETIRREAHDNASRRSGVEPGSRKPTANSTRPRRSSPN